jgi:hypothetical protein
MKHFLYWGAFVFVKFLEMLFILFSFFSGAVIIAHVLKHYFKINVVPFKWMLNDTEDGDYGASWWLEREGLEPSLYSALRWWLRNPCWTFKYLMAPRGGGYENVNVYFNSSQEHPLKWCSRKERATKYVTYEQNGQINARFSHTNALFNFMAGSGNNRYLLKLRRSQ